MKQVVIIHGGDSFPFYETYLANLKARTIDYERLKPQRKWKQWIADEMPGADVLLPTMPNSNNAVYDEWKIYFEKILPFLRDDVYLVGHSLGAMFLVKYLNDTPLSKKVRQLILIASGYNNDIYGEYGSFSVQSALNVPQSAKHIHLFHSEDDPIVIYTEMAKLKADMPEAIVHSFTNREHFAKQTTFPEVLEILKE